MARAQAQAEQPDLRRLAEAISDRWPGRQRQVEQLVGLLGPQGAPAPNLLVHGGPSTGKTAIVRGILGELRRPYVYVSCAEFSRPKHLLQSITNQLKGRKRARSDGFAGSFRGEQVADFLAELPGVAKSAVARTIVVDHAHRIAEQEVLAALLRLRELSGARLGLVLISRVAWGCGAFEHDTCAAPPPLQLPFPAHEPALLASILAVQPLPEVQQHGLEAFKAFLRAEILPVFARSTRRLEDLQALVAALFPLYLRPCEGGEVEPTDGRRLHALFAPTLLAARAAFESGPGWKGALAGLAAAAAQPAGPGKPRAAELDLELPYYSKFLLLAAHLCARNKPTLDRRLFDLSARGPKRRGHMSHDKQVEAAREAALRGPHAFPLERLLAVFWALLGACEGGPPPQQADLLTQLASLVTLRLLSRAGGDELDEARFRCNIPDALALTISKNLGIRLQDYLLYA